MKQTQAPNDFAKQAATVEAAIQSEQYVRVRRRIFRQLLEALLYEGVIPAVTNEDGSETVFRIAGQTEEGKAVTYICRGQRRFTFGRIRLSDGPILRVAEEKSEEAQSFAQFLLEVRHATGADEGRLTAFIHELEHTQLKDTLAQYERQLQGSSFSLRDYDALEAEIMDGHPYHPSYKSRIGFDYADNYQYGPEFKEELTLLWLAVAKKHTRFAISAQLEYERLLQEELGEQQVAAFSQVICDRGLDPQNYWFVPVHPWQWKNIATTALLEDLRNNRVILLGPAQDAYRAQQSIRTLANVSAPRKAYVKLAMSLINTSTGRILAPHTVANAPVISDWLHGIVQSDAFLRDEARVVLLRERMGIAYDAPPHAALVQAKTYGVLGCIWRESLHPYLEPGEQALPFNGLCSLDGNGRPLIAPWIERYGAEAWLMRLFEASVLPIAHMLYAHGIALESHAQNMVLLHREGMPVRVALKDFHDGIRFSKKHLQAPESCPALLGTPAYHARVNRNSFIETDDLALVRDFMHDAFFFINIGELALLMADAFGFSEKRFWGLVRHVLEAYQQRHPHLAERFSLFDLFAPAIEVEQLAKRRLFPDTELRVHKVPNPLADNRAHR
ncbi:IucA/IucC family siderophore biosynthesis protein [Brevibacillus sp. NSP2.1]|uniref:IucA/IucC family protein n=1 Tax=Brevibacillus sp. NSP2.1 TaxID=3003229 RepID=UPI0003F577B0|nr:IucA/IucC family protein [Brevibacillus sp. NSP2.1]QHZ56642.1 IucA/IucC family siderophore biosynthesis protein [Brevibacillus sp. NSP2.1]